MGGGHHPARIAERGGEHVHIFFKDHIDLAARELDSDLLRRRGRLDAVQPELGHQRVHERRVARVLAAHGVLLGLLAA